MAWFVLFGMRKMTDFEYISDGFVKKKEYVGHWTAQMAIISVNICIFADIKICYNK